MNRLITLILALTMTLVVSVSAQPGRGRGAVQGTIFGHVFDSDLQVPVEYATIILYRQPDSVQETGTVTDKDGRFELAGVRPGRYYLEVSFIGYRPRTVDDIEFAPGARLDLGRISLQQTVVAVEGAEVVGEKPSVRYEIDKKVVEVSKNPAAQSGTAVDALEGAPSVNVDIEGNVSLRGSQNFTVLIDGKPTMLEPNEALKQIPATAIDNIEIITNPSAKYDPDGAAGIINVIMKKQKMTGISALSNVRAGLNRTYGGDLLLGYRQGILNAHIGGDYHRRIFNSELESETRTFGSAGTTSVTTAGGFQWDAKFGGVRAGVELQLGERDRTSISGMYRLINVDGRTLLESERAFVSADSARCDTTWTESHWLRDGNYHYASADHQHDFDTTGHKLLFRASYGGWGGTNDNVSEEFADPVRTNLTSGRRTDEDGPNGRGELKLDYTLPLREKDKLEAGWQTRLEFADTEHSLLLFDTTAGGYVPDPGSEHTTLGSRDIHSLYATYSWNQPLGSSEKWNVGVQAGLRGEYGERSIELKGEGQRYLQQKPDLFPSLHTSLLTPVGQFSASYSRRIERPWPWLLQPYETWQDARNVSKGNPELRPEYIDSYEAGYQAQVVSNTLSLEGYYRVTNDMFTMIDTVYPGNPNVILHTSRNVGTDYSLGGELMLNLSPFKWWSIRLSGDVYDYRVETPDTTRKSFNWNGYVNTDFKFPTQTMLQLSTYYSSPAVSSQGEHGSYLVTSGALKQSFLNRSLTVTLRVRDIFGTGRWEDEKQGEGFYNRKVWIGEAPVFSLTLTYNFNNFRVTSKMREGEDMPMQGAPQM